MVIFVDQRCGSSLKFLFILIFVSLVFFFFVIYSQGNCGKLKGEIPKYIKTIISLMLLLLGL